MSDKKVMAIWIAAALAVITALYLFASPFSSFVPLLTERTEETAEQIRTGTAPIPTLTPAVQAKLEKSKGFQALVSYTPQGFEPQDVSIKKGETVRFTNNSGHKLWIAATGESGRIYPYTEGADGCGSSDFDSCAPFDPQDFWEFTFTKSGTWSFENKADTAKSGEVMVRVE